MPVSTCCFAVTWSTWQPFHGFAAETQQGLLACKSPVCCRDAEESLQEPVPATRQGKHHTPAKFTLCLLAAGK